MTTENSKKQHVAEFILDEEMKNINISNDSLKPIEPETDYVSMMQKFKEILNNKDSDWTLHISVINYLRRILKFEKKLFFQFFYGIKIYPKIIEFIDSVRSSLAKNSLILLNELFCEPMPSNEDKANRASLIAIIKSTIPHLISKVSSNKSFIKNDSNICLESLIQNMKFSETLLTFLQLMNSKKNKEGDLSVELSIKMIKSLGKDFFVQNIQFNEFMKPIVSLYEAQKNTNSRKCKNILNCFVEVMGKDEFDKKLDKCAKKEKENIKAIMEEKIVELKRKTTNSSSLHFRKDIKERKKTFVLSKVNNKPNKSVTTKCIPKVKDTISIAPKIKILNDENISKNY